MVLSVTDDIGVRTIMEELLSGSQSKVSAECRASVLILHAFCESTKAEYDDYLPQLFKGLIGLFVRSEQEVLIASWECLNAITKVGYSVTFLKKIIRVIKYFCFCTFGHKSGDFGRI